MLGDGGVSARRLSGGWGPGLGLAALRRQSPPECRSDRPMPRLGPRELQLPPERWARGEQRPAHCPVVHGGAGSVCPSRRGVPANCPWGSGSRSASEPVRPCAWRRALTSTEGASMARSGRCGRVSVCVQCCACERVRRFVPGDCGVPRYVAPRHLSVVAALEQRSRLLDVAYRPTPVVAPSALVPELASVPCVFDRCRVVAVDVKWTLGVRPLEGWRGLHLCSQFDSSGPGGAWRDSPASLRHSRGSPWSNRTSAASL